MGPMPDADFAYDGPDDPWFLDPLENAKLAEKWGLGQHHGFSPAALQMWVTAKARDVYLQQFMAVVKAAWQAGMTAKLADDQQTAVAKPVEDHNSGATDQADNEDGAEPAEDDDPWGIKEAKADPDDKEPRTEVEGSGEEEDVLPVLPWRLAEAMKETLTKLSATKPLTDVTWGGMC